jgi:phosphatidylglycerophosphate synthase
MKIETDVTTGAGQTRAGAPAPVRRGARTGASANGRARRTEPAVATAVLMATAEAEHGPAAAQPWEGATVLRRLLEQLDGLGVRSAHVVTRPEWEDELRRSLEPAPATLAVTLVGSSSAADDLRAVAAVARAAPGGVMVGYADAITHREALAGLLSDPRVPTGILVTGGRLGRPFAWRVRASRGRVVSAASPFHSVHRPNNTFLGVLKVAAANREALVEVAERLAELAADPPESWQRELDHKAGLWRVRLARWAIWRARAESGEEAGGEDDARDDLGEGVDEGEGSDESLGRMDPADVELSAEDEAELRRRLAAAPRDATALLVTGLVRSGVHLGQSFLRKLFWSRPLSGQGIERAGERIGLYDEDRVLLDSAVKASDGFFTTFFVSPYSKYIARWAARRGLTPNQVTTVSLLIGLAAAAAFATGERWGLIAGAVLLQAAFTTDCVDGQLARYSRQFSKLGAWLDSIFDRSKEYLVFAGLAIGASARGDAVWLLAAAAITLQTVRHSFDFSYAAAQHQTIGAAPQQPIEDPWDGTGPVRPPTPEMLAERAREAEALRRGGPGDREARRAAEPKPPQPLPARVLGSWRRLDRMPGVAWVKRVLAFPIGERFAVISLTAALFDPRVTFVVVLSWGTFALLYSLTGRLLRSLR